MFTIALNCIGDIYFDKKEYALAQKYYNDAYEAIF
jgi:hypothetical protein